jgi:hypothetical protein
MTDEITCHTQAVVPSESPNAISLLMAMAGGFGFEYRLGDKAITFEGPTNNAGLLQRSARCLGLEILPGPAPGEVARAIVHHRTIVQQLNTAVAQQAQYQQASIALRGS